MNLDFMVVVGLVSLSEVRMWLVMEEWGVVLWTMDGVLKGFFKVFFEIKKGWVICLKNGL